MIQNDKIRSMVSLLDDTDWEIFETIRKEIINHGDSAIPILEEFWEQKGFDPIFQERVENIIHDIQLLDIEDRIKKCRNPETSLFEGLYSICKYQYPDLDFNKLYDQLESFAQTLETNIYPNARVKDKLAMVNEFFYNKWGFRGNKQNLGSPQNSLISDVLNSRKGNPLLLSSIYYMLCERIGLPVVPINFPRYFILGVYNTDTAPSEYPDYFLDVFGRGSILSEYDLRKFLNSINLQFDPEYLKPCSNIDILKRCLNNLYHAYDVLGYPDKKEEIEKLRNLLEF